MQTAIAVRGALALPAMILILSCGAGAPGAGAKTSADGSTDDSSATAIGHDGPALPRCEGEACFPCGDTICLRGYYCETTGEWTGCAWNSKCAKDASCACLAPKLAHDPRCSCEQRDGGAFVTCSD